MSYNNFNFKNSGNTSEDLKKYSNLNANTLQEFPIGIKLPLRRGSKKGESIFAMNYDVESQIKDNLNFLLTCRKNEILGKPKYGTNLSVIFNSTNLNKEDISNLAKEEISSAIDLFMNPLVISNKSYYVNLLSYNIQEEFIDINDKFYILSIEYKISGYSRRDIEIIKKISNSESVDYLMSKINKIIIKFRTSN